MTSTDLVADGNALSLRYETPPGRPQRQDSFYQSLLQLKAGVTLGSKARFPGYFDTAVQRSLSDPSSADVMPAAARWYFGRSLVFRVDPATLQQRMSDFVQGPTGLRWMGTSFIDAADWSAVLTPVGMSPIHREVTAILDAGLEFHRTRKYQKQLTAIATGHAVIRNGVEIRTAKDLDAYYRYCVALIKSIQKHGAVPRKRFGRFATFGWKHRRVRPTRVEGSERNIGVAITKDGELIRHLGGKHRTAIAQAMELPSIPVELGLVHAGWLGAEMKRTGLPAHQVLAGFLESKRAR